MASQVAHETIRQILRYGLIGLLQNGISYGLYLGMTWAGMPPKPAITLLYLIGATASFFANRRFTFSHDGSIAASGIRFVVAHLCGYLLNLLLLFIFVDGMGYPHQWVQASAIFIVAAFLFITFRLFVFPTQALA